MNSSLASGLPAGLFEHLLQARAVGVVGEELVVDLVVALGAAHVEVGLAQREAALRLALAGVLRIRVAEERHVLPDREVGTE